MDARLRSRIELRGEAFDLFPERAALRVSDGTLLVSDLHWGKAEVFQQSGIAIPSQVLHEDLRRLSQVIHKSGAQRLVILGDLIHANSGVTEQVVKIISQWRDHHRGLPMILVRGNHDRGFTPPESWDINLSDTDLTETNFIYTHEPPETTDPSGPYYWSGHLHPMVRLKGRHDSLRLACFAIGENVGVLPAFSAFTGGLEQNRKSWKHLYAITEDYIVEI